MSTADLAQPLRAAIVANSGITALLATYAGSPAVFTNIPVPEGISYPIITISGDLIVPNDDGLNDWRPIPQRLISVFALNDTPEHYRLADTIAYLLRDLFHRQRQAITVSGWHVIEIEVDGPSPVPSEDQTVGRGLTLDLRLAKQRS